MGLGDGFRVGPPLLVLGERAVDAGEAGVLTLALAGGDDQTRADLLDGPAVRPASQHGVQRVVDDDGRPALAGGGVEPFEASWDFTPAS
ncbi:hypothetical protein ACQPYK_50415 (plasmid) [Streptosporangium sp. CA-135522]|uniref:hypothetical protein n=1 Tax=Streptosporangium sp. CA-135522 TaxID=3240072 RepID=UPI003D8C90D8